MPQLVLVPPKISGGFKPRSHALKTRAIKVTSWPTFCGNILEDSRGPRKFGLYAVLRREAALRLLVLCVYCPALRVVARLANGEISL